MANKKKRGRPRKRDSVLRRYWREAQNRHREKINGLPGEKPFFENLAEPTKAEE